MGLVLGGGLAGVGVVFQAMLRNPLADPYVLGVSGGAALGGALGLVFVPFGVWAGAGAVQVCAFGGALLATLLLWRLAWGATGASALVILLGGTVFNAFAAAAVLLLLQTLLLARARAGHHVLVDGHAAGGDAGRRGARARGAGRAAEPRVPAAARPGAQRPGARAISAPRPSAWT